MIRRLVPYTLLPLALIANVLASAPWLRAFPSGVMSVPLFGAAVLSVLAPLIVVGVGVRRLWLSALIDVVLFVFYTLLVVLREPVGFHHLYTGLVHGPAQILSFALPLVSPRTLLVAPVALCWLSGAIVGECVARGWQTVLPYLTLVVTFGLAYAGTARAVSSSADGRRYDTLFAGALLVTLLLLRAAQAWVAQDESAETTQPEGILPLRGLAFGMVLSIGVAAAAAGAVQSTTFAGRPVQPARTPPVDQSRPLTPIEFVAGLRPGNRHSSGKLLFKISVNRATSNYVALASVDFYDGDSWSFNRTFRPSGGVVPADPDPAMRPHGAEVMQQYTIENGPMTTVPWMPFLDRADRVTGMNVNVDPSSGMIVPAGTLHAGEQYTVESTVARKDFSQLHHNALVGTSASQVDTALADGLAAPLGTLITSLSQETGASTAQPIPFLQAVAHEFRTKASLAGGESPGKSTPSPSAPSPSGRSPSAPSPSAPSSSVASPSAAPTGGRFVGPLLDTRPTPKHSHHRHSPASRRTPARPPHTTRHTRTRPAPTSAPPPPAHTGGTAFADVLASIRGKHAGTPEQFATLLALIARKLGVPARLVSGFRIPLKHGATTLPAGMYSVTSADAWTWVEIPIRGLGWVVLDPSPGTYSGPTPPQNKVARESPSPSPSPTQTAQLTHSNNIGHAVAPPSRTPHAKGVSTAAVVTIVVLALLALAIGFLVFLLARKEIRASRRRRRVDPRRRLLGAWQESLDVLVESGLPDLTYATSSEVAAAARERFGLEPATQVRAVGQAANLAIFSPASPVQPVDADAAWRAHAQLRRSVRRTLRWRARIAARLRYNRPRRIVAPRGPASWAAESKTRTARKPGRHTARALRRRRPPSAR